jgi:hypothetical protein
MRKSSSGFSHRSSLSTHYCPLNDSINYVIVPNCVNFLILRKIFMSQKTKVVVYLIYEYIRDDDAYS